jgi:hypothetical protein
MATDKLVYDYNLKVKGVFGRNRTVKFKSIRLARADRDGQQPDESELRVLTQRQIDSIKLKMGAWVVVRAPVEIDGHFEKFLFFSDEPVFSGQKT